jgi:acetolactate decarboxylase
LKNHQKAILSTGLLFFISLSGMSMAAGPVNRDQLYQNSMYPVLRNEVGEGEVAFSDLKKRGDLGLGTFNRPDGEMIQVDGLFYKIKTDGKVYPVNDQEKIPFAVVTFFENNHSFVISKPMKLDELIAEIDKTIPNKNTSYAVRIKGAFSYVNIDNVSAQIKSNSLTEVVKDQPTLKFRVILGTMVGFRYPESFRGLNPPGYRFHFIDNRRTVGGHLLDGEIAAGTIEIDYRSDFYFHLPLQDRIHE